MSSTGTYQVLGVALGVLGCVGALAQADAPESAASTTEAPAVSDTPATSQNSSAESTPSPLAAEAKSESVKEGAASSVQEAPVTAAPAKDPDAASAPASAEAAKADGSSKKEGAAKAPAAPVAQQPSGPTNVVADGQPRTFRVTAGPKTPAHPFYKVGNEAGFVVDGVPGKELVLTRGVTYTFSVDTGVQHDFYFSTSPVGWGAGTVTDGVKGQYIFRGDATFTPAESAPAVVYYQCRNHKNMGGKLHVAAKGEKVTINAERAQAEQAVARAVTPDKAKQKLGYAEMLLGSSEAVRRAEASDNAEAKNLIAQAREKISAARAALNAGDATAALNGADEAMRLVTSATRLVPSDKELVAADAKYKEMLDQIHGFESSYKQNRSRIGKKEGAELDQRKFDDLLAQAKALAGKDQHAEANKSLAQAQALITTALTNLLNAETMVYDKKFASPRDEYQNELARYKSYEELIPVAIEQRQPSQNMQTLMDGFVTKARGIEKEGKDLAAKGDFKMAIMALQAATENLQRALQLVGVR